MTVYAWSQGNPARQGAAWMILYVTAVSSFSAGIPPSATVATSRLMPKPTTHFDDDPG